MWYYFVGDSALLCVEMLSIEKPRNPGNFLALLKLLATHDDMLRNYLQAPAIQNVTYIVTKNSK